MSGNSDWSQSTYRAIRKCRYGMLKRPTGAQWHLRGFARVAIILTLTCGGACYPTKSRAVITVNSTVEARVDNLFGTVVSDGNQLIPPGVVGSIPFQRDSQLFILDAVAELNSPDFLSAGAVVVSRAIDSGHGMTVTDQSAYWQMYSALNVLVEAGDIVGTAMARAQVEMDTGTISITNPYRFSLSASTRALGPGGGVLNGNFFVINSQLSGTTIVPGPTSFSPPGNHKIVRMSGVVNTTGDLIGIGMENDISIDLNDVVIPDQHLSQNALIFNVNPISAGTTQSSALKPQVVTPGANVPTYLFTGLPLQMWFDPPTSSEYTFTMVPDDLLFIDPADTLFNDETLFDQILGFPAGLDDLLTVSVGGTELGQFGPGDTLDFVSLLGAGVPEFTVSGISPEAVAGNLDPGFALQLEFNTPTASFTMSPAPLETEVPEPGQITLLALGVLLCYAARRVQSLLINQ